MSNYDRYHVAHFQCPPLSRWPPDLSVWVFEDSAEHKLCTGSTGAAQVYREHFLSGAESKYTAHLVCTYHSMERGERQGHLLKREGSEGHKNSKIQTYYAIQYLYSATR